MEWPNDLAARFPAPRADEPPDLRRSIVAELRDHLQTAFQRELLLTADARQAQQNVLAHFGDPVRLARKLWFDAMWEKIMSQRLILVALVVVVLSSLGSTGLTWFLIDHARQANLAMLDQSRAANQALVEQNQKTNEALLAKISALGGAAGTTGKSLEWNPLQVRVFVAKEKGALAGGCEVTLRGHILDSAQAISLFRTTNANGIADFGLVRAGEHSVTVTTPWGEYMSADRSITVQPGEPNTVEIVCPAAQENTDVEITVDWPVEWAGRPLWLVFDCFRSPRNVAGQDWSRWKDHGRQFVAVDTSGKLINFDVDAFKAKGNINPSAFFNPTYAAHVAENPGIYMLREQIGRVGPCIWIPAKAPTGRLSWPLGIYHVENFAIGRDVEFSGNSLPDNLLHPQFLGGIMTNIAGKGVVRYVVPGTSRIHSQIMQQRGGDDVRESITVPTFEAVAGRLNQWRLSVPEPLVNMLKDASAKDAEQPTE